jgi:hypothetical protein
MLLCKQTKNNLPVISSGFVNKLKTIFVFPIVLFLLAIVLSVLRYTYLITPLVSLNFSCSLYHVADIFCISLSEIFKIKNDFPLKTGDGLRCSGRVSSSCSTSGTCHVNLVTNLVTSHECKLIECPYHYVAL